MNALLIKINSIQKYIFQSNLLKENIGASHITCELLFNHLMRAVSNDLFPGTCSFDNWKDKNPELKITDSKNNIECEVGEIGGGGALLFFAKQGAAENFIWQFSKQILLHFPGLKTSFALKENFNNDDFQKERKALIKSAAKQKNEYFIQTTIPKKGIFEECTLSNQMAEKKCHEIDRKRNRIAITAHSKINKAEMANEWYSVMLDNASYTLPLKIDNLWQDPEAGYIAVVYVDGNGMGEQFGNSKSLVELRNKSLSRAENSSYAFKQIFTVGLIDKIEQKILGITRNIEEEGPIPLPIRPLLHGGDDVCFICEGRLGMYLAEAFMKSFASNRELMNGACAGVAIVKTRFPFYKAFALAEELCREAKEASRGDENKGSYISYLYSATTFAGSLASIRQQKHQSIHGPLYFGPYNATDNNAAQSLQKLKEGIKHFKDEKNISKNKVMLLREVMMEEQISQQVFVKEITQRRFTLPGGSRGIWSDNATPFFDQIELMDFYPDQLL